MGGFLNALTFLAPLSPAIQEGAELRRQREADTLEAKQKSELNQQKIREGNAPVMFGEPEWDSTAGHYSVLALDPTKGKIIRMEVPGGDSPDVQQQKKIDAWKSTFKMATGREPNEQESADFAYSTFGIKPSATRGMSAYQQASINLREAEQELKQAQFNASQDPNNPVFRLKLEQAKNAALRGRAQMITAEAGAFGEIDGVKLPGAAEDEYGRSVGYHFASNIKPTSTEIGRADLAGSAIEQMNDMKDILLHRSDMFGPGAGRKTTFTQWIGSEDPDAQRFKSAAVTTAGHLAGVFGGTSDAKLKDIYAVIGQNQNNPAAAIAALDQMEKAANQIKRRGTRKTIGGNPQNPSVSADNPLGLEFNNAPKQP